MVKCLWNCHGQAPLIDKVFPNKEDFMLRIILILAFVIVAFSGCTVMPTNKYAHTTTVHGQHLLKDYEPGTYRYVKMGLTGSGSAPEGLWDASRLGQMAMDDLVKKADLRPNQLLVNVTVERGSGWSSLSNLRLIIVTIQGDVVELGIPPESKVEPKWDDPLENHGVNELTQLDEERPAPVPKKRLLINLPPGR